MKSRSFLILLIIVIIFNSGCNFFRGKVDLGIRNQVKMIKTSGDLQIPGTQVFLTPPRNYPLMRSLGRFEKDQDHFIEVTESTSSSYFKRKSHIDEVMDEAKIRGLNMYYRKEFNDGPYKAYMLYGREHLTGDDQIVMILGNDNFVATIAGVFPTGNSSARERTLKSILSTFIDTLLKPDESIFAGYTLDLAGTSFRYCDHAARSYFYTKGGLGYPQNDLTEDQIMITELPAMSPKAIDKYASTALDKFRAVGFKLTKKSSYDTTINGHYANQIYYRGKFDGKPNSIYQVITGNDKEAVLFCGVAFNQQDSLLQQYVDIARTIKIK